MTKSKRNPIAKAVTRIAPKVVPPKKGKGAKPREWARWAWIGSDGNIKAGLFIARDIARMYRAPGERVIKVRITEVK